MGRTVYGYYGNVYETDVKMTSDDINTKIVSDDTATIKPPKNRSILHIGNAKVYNTKHFNWLNKIMFRIFFGIKIEDIKEENRNE